MSTISTLPAENAAAPQKSIELSVVMPCLNEAETLRNCIAAASEALKRAGTYGEIVIADNGSTDGSQEIARQCGARVVNVPQRGYGNALQGGIAGANGKYILMGDADESYDFSHIPRFLDQLRGEIGRASCRERV